MVSISLYYYQGCFMVMEFETDYLLTVIILLMLHVNVLNIFGRKCNDKIITLQTFFL